jgi:hypothetical protein
MKIELILYIADHKINGFMKAADLCPPYKVFITDKQRMEIEGKASKWNKRSIKKSIMKLIELSKEQENFWIPVIECNDVLYVSEGIKILSNGEHEMFIPTE